MINQTKLNINSIHVVVLLYQFKKGETQITICGWEGPAAGPDEAAATSLDDAGLVEGMPSREAVLEFIAST